MFVLAQNLLAQIGSEVIDSLRSSDQKLQDLNNQLDIIKNDYVQLVGDYNTGTFFNINNIYFWFLILGLVLLLFGLIYLLLELKQGRPAAAKEREEKKEVIKKPEAKSALGAEEPGPKKIANISPVRSFVSNGVNEKKEKIEPSREKKKGPIKIKVIKVK